MDGEASNIKFTSGAARVRGEMRLAIARYGYLEQLQMARD